MAKLYFTRHGRTEWNDLRKVCGVSESKLTDEGRMQAKKAAEYIKMRGFKIDKILCSPLERAKETAQILSAELGIPLEIEPSLIERNCGDFEGKSYDLPEFIESRRQIGMRYGNGETTLQMTHRIYTLLDKLTKNPEHNQTVYILVGHNGISRAVHSYFKDMTTKDFTAWGIKNCQIMEYEFNNLS